VLTDHGRYGPYEKGICEICVGKKGPSSIKGRADPNPSLPKERAAEVLQRNPCPAEKGVGKKPLGEGATGGHRIVLGGGGKKGGRPNSKRRDMEKSSVLNESRGVQ